MQNKDRHHHKPRHDEKRPTQSPAAQEARALQEAANYRRVFGPIRVNLTSATEASVISRAGGFRRKTQEATFLVTKRRNRR